MYRCPCVHNSPAAPRSERQERLERMRARISSMMREADDDENSRISKAVAEQDAKIERELADKFERAQDQMTAIAKHRDQEVSQLVSVGRGFNDGPAA